MGNLKVAGLDIGSHNLTIDESSGTLLVDGNEVSGSVDLTDYYTKDETDLLVDTKQDNLVSGTSIKTINGQSLLGSGDK